MKKIVSNIDKNGRKFITIYIKGDELNGDALHFTTDFKKDKTDVCLIQRYENWCPRQTIKVIETIKDEYTPEQCVKYAINYMNKHIQYKGELT